MDGIPCCMVSVKIIREVLMVSGATTHKNDMYFQYRLWKERSVLRENAKWNMGGGVSDAEGAVGAKGAGAACLPKDMTSA